MNDSTIASANPMTPVFIANHKSNSTELYDIMVAQGKIHSLGTAGNMSFGIYMCIVAVFSLWGNGMVVIVFYRSKKLRKKPHNILLLNMAVADICVSLAGYPYSTVSAFRGRYVFGNAVCAMQGFLTFLLAMVAMTSLVFLSMYRYVCVCKPWLKHKITATTSVHCVVAIWIYAIFWTGPPLLGWSSYTLETFGLSCSVDWSSKEEWDVLYVYCLILFCYLLPIGVMCCCYYRIVQRAQRLRDFRDKVLDIDQARCHHSLTLDVQLSGMCFCMVFFFTLVWSPYAVVSLWAVYTDIPVWATTLPTMFAKLASTLNPYIYVLANPEFRRCIHTMLRSCRSGAVEPFPKGVEVFMYGVRRHAGSYIIDRTKDGIFIGESKVMIRTKDSAMF